MFIRLAKFRPFEPQRVMARWCNAVHSNDNRPSRRRPAGEFRSRPPALVCHWFLSESDGRLECRWEPADLEEGAVGRARCHLAVIRKLEAVPLVEHRSLAAVGA
jgi:hypothetical protein